MPYETQELENQHFLEGMVRCGRITKVKVDKSIRATVTYPDRGFQSHYMVVLQRNTIGNQDHYVPVQGESVWVLMQGKSQQRGVILGSCYTENCPPPFASTTIRGMKFSDGSYIIYDTVTGGTSGNYQISLAGKATITAATTITITTKQNTVINGVNIDTNGNVIIPGNLTVMGTTRMAQAYALPNCQNADGSGGGT